MIDTKACPFCGEIIKVAARKCRLCGEFLEDHTRESVLTEQSKGSTTQDIAGRNEQYDLVLNWGGQASLAGFDLSSRQLSAAEPPVANPSLIFLIRSAI